MHFPISHLTSNLTVLVSVTQQSQRPESSLSQLWNPQTPIQKYFHSVPEYRYHPFVFVFAVLKTDLSPIQEHELKFYSLASQIPKFHL